MEEELEQNNKIEIFGIEMSENEFANDPEGRERLINVVISKCVTIEIKIEFAQNVVKIHNNGRNAFDKYVVESRGRGSFERLLYQAIKNFHNEYTKQT